MYQRWIGPLMVALILGGVASVLVFNLNLKGNAQRAAAPPDIATVQPPSSAPKAERPAGFREYPIGDEVERNQMRIAAVWLPPVEMAGMNNPGSPGMIHLEADIHATADNKNGCAKDEFIPYLTVRYVITPQDGPAKAAGPIRGDMMPMVARDGWHYGASIAMPGRGRYKLTYTIEPPTTAGRHSDAATGVDPWWKPFEVSFDWDYEGK
jgi:uncharacterized protein involved in high-affinity Fe2+ transport